MTLLTGYNATNFPLDTLYSVGVLYIGSTPFGATSGPPKFTPNTTYDNIAFDGKYTDMAGLDRVMHGVATLAATMLEIGPGASGAQITTYEPGETNATVSTVTTHTQAASGTLVAQGTLVADLRCIWPRGTEGSGNYFAVHFPYALCTKYGIDGQDKKNALIPVEFATRLGNTAALNACPYNLEYRTTLP